MQHLDGWIVTEQRNPIIRPPYPGRIHFFWELDIPTPPIPDQWRKVIALDGDGEAITECGIGINQQAWKQSNFVAQVSFHRCERQQFSILGSASDVLKAVAPELLPADSESGAYPSWSTSLGAADASTVSSELPPGQVAVAEWSVVVHVVVATPASVDLDDLQAANSEVIDMVQESIRAVHAATGEARPLPRLESATLGTIAAFQQVTNVDDVSTVWNAGIVLPNERLLRTFEELDDQGIQRLVDAEAGELSADPML